MKVKIDVKEGHFDILKEIKELKPNELKEITINENVVRYITKAQGSLERYIGRFSIKDMVKEIKITFE